MPLIPVGPTSRKAPKVKPKWQEMTVIFRAPSGAVFAQEGWRYGTLAVHPELPDEKEQLVVVTHLPTKLAVVRVKEVEDAIACTEHLWDKCAEAFAKPGEDADRSKIPTDMVQWIKDCNKLRKCVT